MSEEPKMTRNYIMAFVFTMLILLGYPFLLRKFGFVKPAPQQTIVIDENGAPQTISSAAQTPASAFIENPAPPSLIRAETPVYDIDFSTLGGTVTRLFYRGEADKPEKTHDLFYEADPSKPGIFGLRLAQENADLSRSVFTALPQEKGAYGFVFEKPGDFRLTKTYRPDPEKPVIRLSVTLENLTTIDKNYPVEFDLGFQYHKDDHQAEAAALADKVLYANPGKIAKKGFVVSQKISWAGVAKKYFVLLARPDWILNGCSAGVEDGVVSNTLRTEPVPVPAGGKVTKEIIIYAGPQKYEHLKEFGFEAIFSQGVFGFFKIWLLLALKFLYGFTHNYGWAIILLTLALKGLFTPLTHMSYESMKKMQAIQPKLKSLQERYKGDPQKLNREMMQLYKRNKVNPMSGCLPMLLQIPIFISFYQVLNETIELKGAEFILWVHDLAQPDRLFSLPFDIPVIGDSFNFLPLLMIGSMVWQQKLTPQPSATPEQAQITNMMPLIFGFLFYKMPSGLVLYWFMNNMLTIIHQIFIKRMVIVLHHEDQ